MSTPQIIPKPLVQTNQVFIIVTVLLGMFINTNILYIPFVLGLFTVLTKMNPVIIAARPFLRKPADQYHPEDKDQQIFNQWIATIMLGLAILSFAMGWTIAAYVFSIMMLIATGLALFFDFCLGCTVRFQYQMWKGRRKRAKMSQQ